MGRGGEVLLAPCCEMVLTLETDRVLVAHYSEDYSLEAVWVDQTGGEVARPEWAFADNRFASGMARVCQNGRVNYVDLMGRLLSDTWWDDMGCFGGAMRSSNAFASPLTWVRRGERFGFVNRQGELVVPLVFEDAKDFGNGYDSMGNLQDNDRAAVKWQGKWGFIDDGGALVVDCRWDDAQPFEEGEAQVARDGKEYSVDRQGFAWERRAEKKEAAFFFEGSQMRALETANRYFRTKGRQIPYGETRWTPRELFAYLAGRIPLWMLFEDIPETIEETEITPESLLHESVAPMCRMYFTEKPDCTREEKKKLDKFLLSCAEAYMELE